MRIRANLSFDEVSSFVPYADINSSTFFLLQSVMEQHSSLAPDYDYSEKPSSDYPSNETLHIPNMNPEPTTVATTFSYNQEIIPNNLYYSASGINHPYQTINENSAEFDPIYYENTSKNVEPIHQYSVQNSVLDSSSLVPSTIDYIETNAAPVVEYNDVSSLPNEMEHVPPNYTVSNTMQEPCMNVTDNAPSEQLHIASVLLDVPLEQLSNDAVPLQQEVHNESIDFSGVAQEVPTIPDDTSIHFQHESLDNLDGCSNIPGGFEPTADSSEYHDDSSRSMIIDEEPQLSVNYEVEDQTVPENVDISNCEYSESESHPTTEVTDEVTTAENQADDTKEVRFFFSWIKIFFLRITLWENFR